MKTKLFFLFMGLLLLANACDENNNGNNTEPPTIERTVLVYIMGDNSLKGFVNDDIKEMAEGVANVDLTRNNLLVYMDNRTTVKLFRFIKENKTIVQELIESYDSKRNSVGLEEMKEVFSRVYNEYPAESYGLVLWSHGEGWKPGTSSTRWIGEDDTNEKGKSMLSISTLSEALSEIPYYDYILFDACFMQSIEVAYELRHHTGYFIGSPAEIPGPGAPYQKIVPKLFAKSDAAVAIASSYYDYYKETYNEGKDNANEKWTAGVALSVIATAHLEEFATVTKAVLPTIITEAKAVVVADLLDYDTRTNLDHIGYYDFDVYMKKQTTESASYATWRAALDAVVIYAESTDTMFSAYLQPPGMFPINGFSGVSIYIPRYNYTTLNNAYQTFEWYQEML